MKWLVAVAACAVLGGPRPARADEPPGTIIDRARDHFARGELAEARTLLLEAYQQSPDPALLFALGQVELRLGDPKAAIDYYERFLATSPQDDQAALAQQAIGAARMQLEGGGLRLTPAPRPPPPPPPRRVTRRRPWDVEGTGLTVLGGAAVLGGAGLFAYGVRLGDDASGTLTEYGERLRQTRTTQWIGSGVAAAGAILIGVAIVRWRVSSETVELAATATAGGAAVHLGGPW